MKAGGSVSKSARKTKAGIALVLLGCVLFSVVIAGTYAQSRTLRIVSVDTGDFPEVSVRIALDPPTKQALTPADVALTENGRAVSVSAASAQGSSFGKAAVMLVLDVSGSMRGEPLGKAKEAAVTFISEMRSGDSAGVVSFSTKPQLIQGLTEDRQELKTAISGLVAKGNTAIYDAVIAGLRALKGVNADSRVLVLLTDGIDNSSAATMRDCVREARALGVVVYAVGLGEAGKNPAALTELARATGGRYLYAPQLRQLKAIYAGLSREVYGQYVVRYTSAARSEKQVKLTIRVTNAGNAPLTAEASFTNPRVVVSAPARTRGSVERVAAAAPSYLWLLIAIAFAGFSISLIAYFVASSFVARRESLPARLKVYERAWRSQPDARAEPARGMKDAFINVVTAVFRGRGMQEAIFQKIEEAGLALRVSEFMFFHLVTVIVLGIVGYAIAGAAGVLVFVVVGAFLPLAYLDYRAQKRREAFEAMLPDTLMLLAGSLRAGYSLAQAIEFAERELLPPISTEFRRVTREARLGLPLEEALNNLSARVRSQSLEWVVTAINIQKEVGGNLAELLEKVAETLRQREVFNRQVRALSAEGRLSAVILTALPFFQAAILFVVNPTYIGTLFTNPVGIAMVVVALLLIAVGWVWLKNVVTIDV